MIGFDDRLGDQHAVAAFACDHEFLIAAAIEEKPAFEIGLA